MADARLDVQAKLLVGEERLLYLVINSNVCDSIIYSYAPFEKRAL